MEIYDREVQAARRAVAKDGKRLMKLRGRDEFYIVEPATNACDNATPLDLDGVQHWITDTPMAEGRN